MAIAAVASATNKDDATVTSLTITKPTGTADGHVLLAVISWRGDPGTVTLPTGWTQVLFTVGSESRLGSYTLAAGAAEPANYTWSWVNSVKPAGGITTWSGVDTTTPVDVSAETADAALNSDIIAPDATSTVNDVRDVRAWAHDRNDAITEPVDQPERWEIGTAGGAAGSNTKISLGDRAFGAAGALGTATATHANSSRDKAQTIALKPAAATSLPPTLAIRRHLPLLVR